MRRPVLRATGLVLAAALVGGGGAAVAAPGPVPDRSAHDKADRPASSAKKWPARKNLRVATYNLSLNRAAEGQLVADLSDGENEQARTVAEVIQHARPDVVLLNEFDHDDAGEAARLFRENYLEVPQGDADPIEYRYAFVAPSNTGVPSGFDLNNDGTVGGGDDALGFGLFPGQYGMVVLSRYPIDADRARTFQHFRWRDMPGPALPTDPATGEPWYTDEELDVLPLSSKSHWDVPVRVGHRTVHVLAAHPTPPTFDGAEDRNGRRNHDEIRFWADYVTGGRTASYIYDDDGRRGGLHRGASFVILGDYNADPADGDSYDGAIHQLLDNRRIQDPAPTSEGAAEAAALQGGANESHLGDPALDTADFADNAPGNLRVDYTLPSRNLRVRDAGVFWPTSDDPLSRLTGTYPFPSSDHRLVWVDIRTR
ncbi:endonuclease/exonuclease/phosphatase family protein [Myceligenerans pegani]|uniref:Endonuclease/exonuclease/phosphatase family protein n=1 Tax=Myceligenerans pegani TaxID=2776917 RepID=A0ABR9N063_9MICO|nr:endonuclease/exonuclease/phosphatase family protein [Myceligenerans sp. TRM 65318]MBE1877036.1 endonuclease/exonuclease/phosphatase family protein [Myceligenerans sp. TRM 65318]MBE3019307.1 endonuclease/exonuclease/phosphatase family protein [Myceligenerans sp. TRM 65318]